MGDCCNVNTPTSQIVRTKPTPPNFRPNQWNRTVQPSMNDRRTCRFIVPLIQLTYLQL